MAASINQLQTLEVGKAQAKQASSAANEECFSNRTDHAIDSTSEDEENGDERPGSDPFALAAYYKETASNYRQMPSLEL